MSRKLKVLLCCSIGLLGLVGLVLALPPGAIFELDGNSTVESTHDWNQLNTSVGEHTGLGGSIISTFIASENPPKIFTKGGSKDPIDVSSWTWKPADTVPDKDAITNAYAAEYVATDQFFFFGGERYATNGDSNIGVWFFQQNIGPQSDLSFGPGVHSNGDIFSVSAFTNGGGNPGISVYKWDTSCTKAQKSPVANLNGGPASCAAINLSLAFLSTAGVSCNVGDDACAVVNHGNITVGWPYANKFGGSANTVPDSGFFEAGIDVTALFPRGEAPCFSSFLLETRSSQEPSAVLKDFVQGAFNTCGEITVAKDCNCTGVTADFSQYVYSVNGTVHNTNSFGPFHSVVVTDGALTCTIGDVAAGATVAWGAGTAFPCSPQSSFTSTAKPATNTATVTWSRTVGGTTLGPNSTGLTTCDASAAACVLSPGIHIEKVCTATPVSNGGGPITIQVDYSFTVSNTGN